MDKLKYIKLENEDGSYSDSIPLAVDAEHVDVNGATLSTVLNNKANAADVSASINSLSADIDLQTSRIDNLAHLEEGSTTGDAELIDGRTDISGATYQSIGNHIRGVERSTNNINKNADYAMYGSNINLFERQILHVNSDKISGSLSYVNKSVTMEAGGYCFLWASHSEIREFVKSSLPLAEFKKYGVINISFRADNIDREKQELCIASTSSGGTSSSIYTTNMKYDEETSLWYGSIPVKYFDTTYNYFVARIDNRKENTAWSLTDICVTIGYSVVNDNELPRVKYIPETISSMLVFHSIETALTIPAGRFIYPDGTIWRLPSSRTIHWENVTSDSNLLALIAKRYYDTETNRTSYSLAIRGSMNTASGLSNFNLKKNEYVVFTFWKNLSQMKDGALTDYPHRYRIDNWVEKDFIEAKYKTFKRKIDHAVKYEDISYVSKSGVTDLEEGFSIATGGWYFSKYLIKREPNPGIFTIAVELSESTDVKPSNIQVCPRRPGQNDETQGGGVSYLRPSLDNEYLYLCDYDIHEKTLNYDEEDYSEISIRLDNRDTEEGNLVVKSIKVIYEKYGSPDEGDIEEKYDILYVGTNGNDANAGNSTSYPLATINAALEKGAKTIIMLPGRYEALTCDLSKTSHAEIHLQAYANTNEKVIIRNIGREIAKSEELVSGYTKVYKALNGTINTYNTNDVWIIQDFVNEASTLITDEDRHPCQRGMTYRCDSTRIVKTSASTLEAALTEIENSDDYKFFYDESTSTYYFSRPQEVDSSHPISVLGRTSFLQNTNRQHSLYITGIELDGFYMALLKTNNSVISDCKVKNVAAAGGFRYDRSVNATFIKCEAQHVQNGSNGDGFNGHSESTGDFDSKQTVVELRDCWAHDNFDDGYSDHERSEIAIHGGLYEWNGKAGVTPSYGSHCSCVNVYSRNNYAGFYYTGAATQAEGGKYGQMICYNCVAENNRRGGTKTGFKVANTGNNMILVNCKSINNEKGFDISSDAGTATLIDCGSLNNDTVLSGTTSKYVIKNTTLVTLN